MGGMGHESVEVPDSDWRDIFANHPRQHEVDENILLLPGRVLGYATGEKLWGQFSVDLMRSPRAKCTDVFETHLQLEWVYKRLLKALFSFQEEPSRQKLTDVVEGRRRGLVLLFHGKFNLESGV